MAVTYQRPLAEWYYEDTSPATLDYPPFFAYFEYLLSLVAQFVEPAMLELRATPYDSARCLFFQRLSVIVTETVLVYAVSRKNARVFVAVLWNCGLVIVDSRL